MIPTAAKIGMSALTMLMIKSASSWWKLENQKFGFVGWDGSFWSWRSGDEIFDWSRSYLNHDSRHYLWKGKCCDGHFGKHSDHHSHGVDTQQRFRVSQLNRKLSEPQKNKFPRGEPCSDGLKWMSTAPMRLFSKTNSPPVVDGVSHDVLWKIIECSNFYTI